MKNRYDKRIVPRFFELDILANLSPHKVQRIREDIMERCWTCKNQKYGVALGPRGDRQCKQRHEDNVAALTKMQTTSQRRHKYFLGRSIPETVTESRSPVNNNFDHYTIDEQYVDEKDILIDELLCLVGKTWCHFFL